MGSNGIFANVKTFSLPTIVGNPINFLIHDGIDGKNLIIASTAGLHHMRLENSSGAFKYIRSLKFGVCMGVVLINHDIDSSFKTKYRIKLAAVFSETIDRSGPNTDASILFFDYDMSIGGECEMISKMTCERVWGRIRRMVYSSALDKIYLSTKFDHDFRGIFQTSCIWALPATDPVTNKPCTFANRLIEKTPANFRQMAINDRLKILAVSNLGDDVNHSVDLYNAQDGQLYTHIVRGHGLAWPLPLGVVRFPRGLAFDGGSRMLIVDETKRVQMFNLRTKRCESLLFKTLFDSPEDIVVNGQEIYFMGSQKKSGRLQQGAYLTICSI